MDGPKLNEIRCTSVQIRSIDLFHHRICERAKIQTKCLDTSHDLDICELEFWLWCFLMMFGIKASKVCNVWYIVCLTFKPIFESDLTAGSKHGQQDSATEQSNKRFVPI